MMRNTRRERGFTLMELMVTVVILGILTVVATVGYRRYKIKAKSTEAVTFLANIKMKQVTHFQTYGQYVDTSSSPASHTNGDFYPTFPTNKSSEDMDWDMECPDDKVQFPGWCALGARPTGGKTSFQYVTVGWQSGDPKPPNNYIKDPTRRWWYAEARGNLDGNDALYSQFILTSEVTEPMMFNENN
jgi:prepilin-type N-terminal cleavage/methylation domain-containing protein